jgi:hypothetical protein
MECAVVATTLLILQLIVTVMETFALLILTVSLAHASVEYAILAVLLYNVMALLALLTLSAHQTLAMMHYA